MKHTDNAKEQLLTELEKLHLKIAELEKYKTEQKQAEKVMRESRERFRELADFLPQIVYEADLKGNITYANIVAFDKFGYTQKDFDEGVNVLQVLIPEDRKRAKENIQNILNGKTIKSHEYIALKKNGSTFPIMIYSDHILKDGKPVGIRGVIVDITDHKQAEEALKKSEEQFRLIAENTSDLITMQTFDLKSSYTYVSHSIKVISGYEPEELLGRSVFEFIHPDDKKKILPLLKKYINLKIKKLLTGKELPLNVTIELRFKNKSGNWRYAQSTGNIVGDQLLFVTRDITERKQAEEALKKSEEQFRLITENTSDVITLQTFDMKAVYTYASPSIKSMNGYEPEEMLGRSAFEFIHPDDKKMLLPLLKKYVNMKITKLIFGKESSFTEKIEFRFKNKSGDWRYAESIGNIVGDQLLFVTRDITERKQAEEALKKSEEQFRLIAENTLDCIWKMDKDLRFIYVNPSIYVMFGFTPEEWVGSTLAEHCSKEEMQRIMDMIAKEMKKGNLNKTLEMLLIHKGGRKIPVEIRSKTLVDEKKELIGFQGTTIDITERKQAEKELRESEEKYKRLVELNPEAIVIHNGRKIIYGNKAALDLLHIPNPKDFVEKPVLSFVHQDYIKIASSRIKNGLDHGIYAKPIEEKFLCVDGEVIDVEVTSIPISYDEKPAMLVIGRNITESKKAEEAVIFEQKQLLSMFDSIDESIYVADPDTYELIYFNNVFKSRWKANIGDKCYKIIQGQNSPCSFCSNKHIFGKNLGKTHIWEFQNLVDKHWYRYIDKAIKWPDGRMMRYEMAIDINESKIIEEELKESEEQYRILVESLEEGIASVDENENFIFVSPAACNTFGYTKEELLQMNFKDILSQEEYKKILQQTAKRKTGKAGKYDLNIIKKNGDVRILNTGVSPIFENGKYKGSFGIFHDVTERRKVQETLQKYTLQLETLHTITSALSTSLELNDVLQLILDQIAKAIPYDSACIFLIENEKLKVAITKGLPPDLVGQAFPMDEPLFHEIQSTMKPMVIPDIQADPRFGGWGGTSEIRSWMGTPLVVHDVMIGYLTLDSYQLNTYTSGQTELIQPFVAQAAQTIHNARMYENVIKKTNELENFNKIAVNREVKMIKLKKEINELYKNLGKESKYRIAE